MDEVIDSLNSNNAISIIGNNSQVLQILLKKYHKIIVNKSYISYASTTAFDENAYHEDRKSLLAIKPKAITHELICLQNINESFEYIGLSNQGKILKIIPMLYNNLCIRLDAILSFNDSVNLYDEEDIKKTLFPFFIRIRGNNRFILPRFFLVESSNNNLLDYNQPALNQLLLLREFIYLSSNHPLIEKRLGDNESITININGLLAFEKSVSFSHMQPSNKENSFPMTYLRINQDITITGPGLIIYEIVPKIPIIHNSQILMVKITLIMSFCLIIIQLLTDYLFT